MKDRLKILHIGNIANNAYLNSKILNDIGHDNHVLNSDYYHIMGCPEWEDIDIQPRVLNDFSPKWFKVNQNYERPKWFVQGPLDLCLDYLISYNLNNADQANLWHALGEFNRLRPRSFSEKVFYVCRGIRNKGISLIVKISGERFHSLKRKIFNLIVPGYSKQIINSQSSKNFIKDLSPQLIAEFNEIFNDRADPLILEDILLYQRDVIKLRRVLSFYDVVCCYGTNTYLPLIAGVNDYVAYEHGTIRDLPFQNSSIGRITALAYAKAKAIHMTNADSIKQATKLNNKVVFGCHGFIIGEAQKKAAQYGDISLLRTRLGLKLKKGLTILQSTRQHWDIKGNDKFLKSLADLKMYSKDFNVILIEWGSDLKKSKNFIRANGLQDNVHWISPLSKPQLLKLYQEVDVIIDQFNIPCIGATPLEIFAVRGGALITYLDDTLMENFYGETIPLINCSDSYQISEALKNIINGSISVSLVKENCFRWLKKTHSPEVIAKQLLKAFETHI